MKSILLAINPDPALEMRVRATGSLARRLGAHISCVQVVPPPLAIADPAGAAMPADFSEAALRQAEEIQAEVEALLATAEVKWSWSRLFGSAASILSRQGRLSDLIVLAAADSYPPVAPVATHAHAPVLALPSVALDLEASAPALVAWNGSAASAHALRHAVPLLAKASDVHLITVGEDHGEFGLRRAVEYLEWHEVPGRPHHRKEPGKGPVSEIILELAAELRAGLIVAGAFGHNRIREMLLGSVTRALLKGSRIPLLLAH